MTFDPLQAVVDARRVYPEPLSLPESLDDDNADAVTLAEARMQLVEMGQIVTELRKLVDEALAVYLPGGALRYGNQIIRLAGRGRARVVDKEQWWDMVAFAVGKTDNPAALLSTLYAADSVRLTGLPQLAAVLDLELETIRDTMIDYDPPTALLSVMPVDRAPKWAQRLQEGQLSNRRADVEQP